MKTALTLTVTVAAVVLMSGTAAAQHIAPNALLTIDQNRATVVERIVGEWGDRLTASNAGINSAQLREILSGLRSDHLLAASLAGNMEGLRNVVAGALVHTDAAVSPGRMHAKALGDTGDDLVYTPIVPCRILDTRNGTTPPYNAQMVGGSAFPVAANLVNFAPQGGSATNCTLPSSFAAIAVTLTVLNPNFDAFMAASSSSNFATLTQSVVMDFSANKGLANTAIVPVDGTVKFYLGLPASVTTHVIADAVGYFRAPNGSGGQFFKQAGNAFGTPAVLGTTDDFTLDLLAHNARAMRYQPTGGSPNIIGGHPNNQSSPVLPGQVVAGGGDSATNCYEPSDGSSTRNCRNRTAGDFATIGGGGGNLVDNISGTIAGGESNNASSYATVGGGLGNRALGQYSVVPGGRDNLAFGTASIALGQRAQADYDGCFVFGDGSTGNAVQCNERDRFVVRATHGIFMFTGGSSQATYTGAVLPPGATAWIAGSDRAGKDNLRSVNAKDVLRKVAAMPIATWNWKSQDASIRHMGPMAQDFHAAFGLGETPKGISTVDADGVALAAIQGLNQLIKQKDRKISAMERELAAIKQKLNMP